MNRCEQNTKPKSKASSAVDDGADGEQSIYLCQLKPISKSAKVAIEFILFFLKPSWTRLAFQLNIIQLTMMRIYWQNKYILNSHDSPTIAIKCAK